MSWGCRGGGGGGGRGWFLHASTSDFLLYTPRMGMAFNILRSGNVAGYTVADTNFIIACVMNIALAYFASVVG